MLTARTARAIEDALERWIDVPAAPARIVSLAPPLTELVVAAGAGDRLVGVVDEDPVAAARVGGRWDVSPDAVFALAPDLVLMAREEPLVRRGPRARRRSFTELLELLAAHAPVSVSYTHLTLPTTERV